MGLTNCQKVGQVIFRERLRYLKELIKASLINIPYQSFNSIGIFLPRERRAPTYEQLVRSFETGEGGVCYHINVPLRRLLQSHGFETQLVSANFTRTNTGYPITHPVLTVKIPDFVAINAGTEPRGTPRVKTYLVDVGSASPLHEPVDLDHLPFSRKAGGMPYRIERVNDTVLRRINENGDTLKGQKPASYKSTGDCFMDLTPRHFSEFSPALNAFYTKFDASYLHRGLFCFRYLDITEDDFECVYVYGTSLIFVTKESRRVETFSNYEQLKPSLFKYFPMVNRDDIELSVKLYSIPFEEAVKMSSRERAMAVN